MTSQAYEEYRRLEKRLIHVRWLNRGLDSPEEEMFLDAMEAAWRGLADEERQRIDAEPPRSLIRDEPAAVRRGLTDVDVVRRPRDPFAERRWQRWCGRQLGAPGPC